MKNLGRALLAVTLALVVSDGRASAQSPVNAVFFSTYDVPSTSYNYCIQTGQNGGPLDAPISGLAPITTSGSSTTVSAVTAATSPFRDVVVGDRIFVRTDPAGTTSTRAVTARASADSITVDSAINLSAAAAGYLFTFRHQTCGTGAENGWVTVPPGPKSVQLCISTINATSITFTIEERLNGAPAASTAWTTSALTATGCQPVIPLAESTSQVRVGVKLAGDAGAQSADARIYAEGR